MPSDKNHFLSRWSRPHRAPAEAADRHRSQWHPGPLVPQPLATAPLAFGGIAVSLPRGGGSCTERNWPSVSTRISVRTEPSAAEM
jgi:hypothetical protein